MGIKLFGTLGATLEILLLRAVVRTDEAEGREAALKRIADNQVIVLMIALPAALGLFCVLPPFEKLFVPAAYHGHFGSYFAVMLPAFIALTVTQAAFNPVFMIARRTLPTTAAAGAGLVVNALVLWWAMRTDAPFLFGAALSAGFLVIMAVTIIWSLAATPERPPARDLAWLAGALALMAAVTWPLREAADPWMVLPAMLLLGTGIYAAIMLAGDVAGCRRALKAYLRPGGGS
jgi:O-antigen/teichoic acid export membrane protein